MAAFRSLTLCLGLALASLSQSGALPGEAPPFPLLQGGEVPLPLDALVADGPWGPIPFPFPGASGHSPFESVEHKGHRGVRGQMHHPSEEQKEQMRHMGPMRHSGHMGHMGLHGGPWSFMSMAGPPPPRPPHPPPFPPPPGAIELALKLLGALGAALDSFYSNKTASEATPSISTFSTCGYCVGNETSKLVSAVESSLSSLCASAIIKNNIVQVGEDPGPPTPPSPLQHFCTLFPRLPAITALALLEKSKLNPLSLGLTRCAAEGPCSLSPSAPASSSGAHLFAAVHQMEREMEEVSALEKPQRDHSDAEGDPILLDPSFPDFALSSDGASDCEECIVSGFQLVREVVSAKFQWVCAHAKCPRIRAMCNFTREYPYAAMIALVLKLKPWEKVIPGCFLVGACSPPPPPPQPPHPPPMDDVHPLPLFPSLDLDIFAPPPPPPPPFCFMGAVTRFFTWMFGIKSSPPSA